MTEHWRSKRRPAESGRQKQTLVTRELGRKGGRSDDATVFNRKTLRAIRRSPEEGGRRRLNHTKRGELVYDPFLGSGTTLAAAELTERVCNGLELDATYVDVIVRRWQGLSGRMASSIREFGFKIPVLARSDGEEVDGHELVYDPFLGSGTTLAAAELTERVCCGIELDPKYVHVIVQRWQALSGKPAKLEADGRTFAKIAEERGGMTEAGR